MFNGHKGSNDSYRELCVVYIYYSVSEFCCIFNFCWYWRRNGAENSVHYTQLFYVHEIVFYTVPDHIHLFSLSEASVAIKQIQVHTYTHGMK